MANTKISALTSASTPLAGTEVLPIVQSGSTVKVAVSDLTAGRAISATQLTLTTGNVIVANGQGIDFSATSGTGTSELFADYEEGTWTPTVTNGGLGSATTSGFYTKMGRNVSITGSILLTSVGTASGTMTISGLPFTNANAFQIPSLSREIAVTGIAFQFFINTSASTAAIQTLTGTSPTWINNYNYTFSASYIA